MSPINSAWCPRPRATPHFGHDPARINTIGHHETARHTSTEAIIIPRTRPYCSPLQTAQKATLERTELCVCRVFQRWFQSETVGGGSTDLSLYHLERSDRRNPHNARTSVTLSANTTKRRCGSSSDTSDALLGQSGGHTGQAAACRTWPRPTQSHPAAPELLCHLLPAQVTETADSRLEVNLMYIL